MNYLAHGTYNNNGYDRNITNRINNNYGEMTRRVTISTLRVRQWEKLFFTMC